MCLEEGKDLIEQHRIQGAFLLIHRAWQLRLDLGFALDWGAIDGNILITDKFDSFGNFEILKGSCHTVQNGEQFELQAGGNISVRTVLVRFVQVLDFAEVRSRAGRLMLLLLLLLMRIFAVVDRV